MACERPFTLSLSLGCFQPFYERVLFRLHPLSAPKSLTSFPATHLIFLVSSPLIVTFNEHVFCACVIKLSASGSCGLNKWQKAPLGLARKVHSATVFFFFFFFFFLLIFFFYIVIVFFFF